MKEAPKLCTLSTVSQFVSQQVSHNYRQHCAQRNRRYLVYSEADFEVFRPAGATRCTDGVKFGTEEPNFTPSMQRQGCRTPKTDIFTEI